MEIPKSPGFPPRSSGAQRLELAVSELPLRYAPFFARLAGLWCIPEERVIVELTRARDANGWSRTPLRGVKTFAIDRGQLLSGAHGHTQAQARLLRFSPGVHFPRHRHRGVERVLVLEGSYGDSSGCRAQAGDEQLMPAGSEHELHILGGVPCVAAVVEQGIDFTGPMLRWASKLWRAATH